MYLFKVVVFGQKWYTWAKWFCSGKVVVVGQKWFYSGKSGSIPAKIAVFGQKWL